ncbi:MAG: DNA polymerase III subunit beta [bacterium]
MKATVAQADFSKTLAIVASVVPAASSIPVLSNMLIEARERGLRVSSTDLDISIISEIEADVSEEGSIIVAARRLNEIVRELSGEDVHLEGDEKQLRITSARAAFRLMGMEKEQFPKIADLEGEKKLTVDGSVLQKMIKSTTYAVAKDETRPVLSGVLWEMDKEEMSMVGTDAHRLARMSIGMDSGIESSVGLIVLPKALHHVSRLIEDGTEVGIAFDRAFIGFFVGKTTVYSRRIEGNFPDYKQVIPTNNQNILKVNRLDLMTAIRRVSLLSDSKTRKIKVHLSKKGLRISTSSPDLGEAEEEVPADYVGEEMVVGYNANYLLDVLKTTDASDIAIEIGSPVGPTVLRPIPEPEGESYLCLIMPLRLSESE